MLASKLTKPLSQTFFLDPELIERTDSRELAEQLIKRLNAICDKKRDPSMQAPAPDSSQIIMLVPDQHVASILKNGFKNQHQTSVTRGANAKTSRLTSEMAHISMGLPYTDKTRELLPKYAMQVFKDPKRGTYSAPFNYGNVMFRFKEQVSKRATWSHTDSLGLGGRSAPLRTNSIAPAANTNCEIYCEAQVWGELDRSDVASIMIPEGMKVTDELKAFGVPIKTYKQCADCSPENTNVKGFKPSEANVYSPTKGVVAPTVVAAEDLVVGVTPAKINPAEQNLANSKRLQALSTVQILKELAMSQTDKTETPTPGYGGGMGGWGMVGDSLAKDRSRLIAELTTRKKDPFLTAALMDIAVNGADTGERAVALSGLGRLSFDRLKPILLKNLERGYGAAGTMAFYMGLEHLEDSELRAALEKFDVDLLKRFQGNTLCVKDKK
ncbi:MAG: hypothetical protein IPJ84_09550 [Bdellovibrionales bacterium]|nr:hypothetical protein [Bdellovibrionales bacterium]